MSQYELIDSRSRLRDVHVFTHATWPPQDLTEGRVQRSKLDGSEVETLVTDLQDPGNWEGAIGMQSGNPAQNGAKVGCPLFHGLGGHMQPLCYGLGELFCIGFEKLAPDTAHGSRGMQVA